MKCTVTYEFDNQEDLHIFTSQFAGGVAVGGEGARITIQDPPSNAPVVTGIALTGAELIPAKKRGPKPKTTAAGPDMPAVADPLSLDDVAPAATTEAKEATIDDVRAVLMSFNSKHGLKALGEKLKAEFGVSGMKGLKASQYADVVKSFTP